MRYYGDVEENAKEKANNIYASSPQHIIPFEWNAGFKSSVTPVENGTEGDGAAKGERLKH